MYRSDAWLRAQLRDVFGTTDFEPLLRWVHAARDVPPVLFVGAGFSINSRPKESGAGHRMHTWGELTRTLREDLGDGNDASDDSLWVAERYRRRFGSFSLYKKILQAVPDEHVEPGPEHFALAGLRWHAVLTLNYDTLLERAFASSPRPLLSIVADSQLVRATETNLLPIVHLHGHIAQQESLVLSLEDYRNYPQKHPAFLTIARQMLLQHPVLFLGFGATDPNFVAWSGWIRDAIGELSQPWVRLDRVTTRQPDIGFEGYWSPRMQTVRYGVDMTVQLLKSLEQAIAPLRAFETLDYAREVVGLTQHPREQPASFDKVIAEVERVLRDHHQGPRDIIARYQSQDIVSNILRSALQAGGLSEDMIKRIFGDSREWIERLTVAGVLTQPKPSDALTFEEQRRAIKQAMGDGFVSWLTVAVRLAGRTIPISRGSVTHLDAVHEYTTLRCDAGGKTPARAQELGLLTLPYQLEQRGASAVFDDVLAWFGVDTIAELSEKARAEVTDAWARHELQWSATMPNRSEDPRADAQSLRRAGYFALLGGQMTSAAEFYDRALHASAREGEPSIVRFLTAMSLDALLLNADGVPDAATRHAKLQPEINNLREENAAALLILESGELQHETTRRKRAEEAVDDLETDTPDRTILRGYSEPLETSLEFHERHWLSPWSCASVAERIAAVRWRDGDLVSSAAMFARYGSDELSRRAAALQLAPRRRGVDGGLIAELLRPARWKHELRVRVSALGELAPEMPAKKATELLALAKSALVDLQNTPSLMGTRHTWPHQPAVKLGIAVAKYLPWNTFYRWFVDMNAASGDQLWSVADVPWQTLPISHWLESGKVPGEELDALLRCQLRAAGTGYTAISQARVFDVMLGAFERTKARAILEAPSALEAMRTWFGSGEPQDDDDEWLRSEAGLFLATAGAQESATFRRERAAVQQGLIRLALVGGRSPNSALVNAWLENVGPLEGEARELAWQIARVGWSSPAATPEPTAERGRWIHVDRAIARTLARVIPTELESSEWSQLAMRVCERSPGVAGEIASRWPNIPEVTREFLVHRIGDGLAGIGPHRDRAEPSYIALDSVERASRHSAAGDIPRPWVLGAAQLTTSTSHAVASRACRMVVEVAGQCQWSEEDGDVLSALRDSLLRATSEGRADVVAGGLRGLLDLRCSTDDRVRSTIGEHSATTAALERLAVDDRLAVVSVRENWVRRPRAVRPRSHGE